jgi:hypothetical protein
VGTTARRKEMGNTGMQGSWRHTRPQPQRNRGRMEGKANSTARDGREGEPEPCVMLVIREDRAWPG